MSEGKFCPLGIGGKGRSGGALHPRLRRESFPFSNFIGVGFDERGQVLPSENWGKRKSGGASHPRLRDESLPFSSFMVVGFDERGQFLPFGNWGEKEDRGVLRTLVYAVSRYLFQTL